MSSTFKAHINLSKFFLVFLLVLSRDDAGLGAHHLPLDLCDSLPVPREAFLFIGPVEDLFV